VQALALVAVEAGLKRSEAGLSVEERASRRVI
jgi:hypothetical protein